MQIEKRREKEFHIVTDNSAEHRELGQLIPTAIGTDAYVTVDFTGFRTDEEATAKIQATADEYLSPGQMLLCPLVVLGLDKLGRDAMTEACQIIRAYLSSLEYPKPKVITIINHSGFAHDICEKLHLYQSDRNIYPTMDIVPPCITEEAVNEIRSGIPVECSMTPNAFKKYKDRAICKNGNRFLCLNALTSENIAFIADRKQFCAPYDPEEIWTDMEADCMSIKITDLIF